ncbi:serine/threonine-protein kinase [Kiritimatiellota bacterium B12222]|nr:serine/threonine-protein kinase [Kiritimatiellota bacterium B12222]
MTSPIKIPGYSMVNKIAEGGMATVWKACQEKLDRVVAIKVLLKQADSDQQEYERFIYEARAAASLIHPNIVQVIDAGEHDLFLYYVMEYVPGPTAGDLVDSNGALPEAQALQIGLEVSEALDYAWRDHRVVHCDIKPDNLLLHRNGRTKIADLGLAQVLGSEGVAIEDDMTLGTPNYFPPEQALVEDTLDCRTDMYALGATLYHLGTGSLPFGDMSPEEVASQQVHGQIPSPKEINPKLSYGFCALVERLMAKDQQHRYDGWEDVMADIMRVREGGMIRAPLSGNIRSTVEHTPLPANMNNRGNKIVRKRGARPAGSLNSGGQPIHRTVNVNADALSRTRANLVKEKPANIWPAVLLLTGIATLLYGYTFLF